MGEVIQVLHSRSHSVVRWWGQCPGAERLSKHGVEGRSFENRIYRQASLQLLPSCVFSAALPVSHAFVRSVF